MWRTGLRSTVPHMCSTTNWCDRPMPSTVGPPRRPGWSGPGRPVTMRVPGVVGTTAVPNSIRGTVWTDDRDGRQRVEAEDLGRPERVEPGRLRLGRPRRRAIEVVMSAVPLMPMRMVFFSLWGDGASRCWSWGYWSCGCRSKGWSRNEPRARRNQAGSDDAAQLAGRVHRQLRPRRRRRWGCRGGPAVIGPMVEPHGRSVRCTNCCTRHAGLLAGGRRTGRRCARRWRSAGWRWS